MLQQTERLGWPEAIEGQAGQFEELVEVEQIVGVSSRQPNTSLARKTSI